MQVFFNLFTPGGKGSNKMNQASDAVESASAKFQVPYLGQLPMDPNLMLACEKGESFTTAFPNSLAAKSLNNIIDIILKSCEKSLNNN